MIEKVNPCLICGNTRPTLVKNLTSVWVLCSYCQFSSGEVAVLKYMQGIDMDSIALGIARADEAALQKWNDLNEVQNDRSN